MKEETSNTEQSILKAAEKEFLKKGFSGSKTTEIAKEAGVTHAMLHYYFRTKENLFNKVFEEKAKQLADTFLSRVDESLPFLEKIKCFIEAHFDLLTANPELPLFIYREILTNECGKEICRKTLFPNFRLAISLLDRSLQEEIKYGIRGERKLTEVILDHLSGYKNSKPVRIGNDAYHQRQNDSFGYLMDLIYQYYRLMPGTLDEIEDMWEMVKSIMMTVVEDWRKPDKGIWEIRGEGQHFVSSKVMCWVALDRGARIARILNKYENSRRWEEEADAIKADVMRNGWKEEIQSFSQAYGNLDLDSSLLLMEPYGFIDADDIRYHKTVKAVKKSLLHKGLMYRYNTHDDFGCPSSAFTICTFWLIRALYVIGEKNEARCLFDEILQYSNHLGLFSEDIDFETKEQLGNFPQAYSHLALVNTAVLFAEEDKRLIFK